MATYQAGEVGKRLDDGANLITGHSGDLNKLANGADTLADSLGDVRGQVGSAINSVRGLVDALGYVQGMFGGNKTLNQLDNAAKLVNGMRELGDAIIANLDNVSESFSWTGPVLRALDSSPVCITDPVCASARIELQRLGYRAPGRHLHQDRRPGTTAAVDGWRADPRIDPDGTEQRPRDGQPRDARFGAGQTRQPSGSAWPCCSKGPTPWQTPAARSPMAYSCWSTRPNRWAAGSGRRRSSCSP